MNAAEIKQLYLRYYFKPNQLFDVESYSKCPPIGYIIRKVKFRNKFYIHSIDKTNSIYIATNEYYKRLIF